MYTYINDKPYIANPANRKAVRTLERLSGPQPPVNVAMWQSFIVFALAILTLVSMLQGVITGNRAWAVVGCLLICATVFAGAVSGLFGHIYLKSVLQSLEQSDQIIVVPRAVHDGLYDRLSQPAKVFFVTYQATAGDFIALQSITKAAVKGTSGKGDVRNATSTLLNAIADRVQTAFTVETERNLNTLRDATNEG